MIEEHKNSRIYELDALRAFGFLFVVAQHVFGGFAHRPEIDTGQALILSLIYVIAKPAVPIFMVLLGLNLFLYSKYKKPDFKEFYKKKIKKLFIPYIIWSVMIIILDGEYEKFNHIIGNIITGNTQYHLWYMGMLMRVILFFPLIWVFFNDMYARSKLTRRVLFALFVVAFWAINNSNDAITVSVTNFIFDHPSKLQERFIGISPILWSLYLVIGVKIAYEYDEFIALIDKLKWYVIGVYPLLLAYNYYDEVKSRIGVQESDLVKDVIGYSHSALKVAFMVISILVFYIVSSYVYSSLPKAYKALQHISNYSYAGYLVHAYLLQVAAAPIIRYGMPCSIPLDIAIYVVTILLSIELIHIISYLPYSHLLTGSKRVILSLPGMILTKPIIK